jgi:hypothetical protein
LFFDINKQQQDMMIALRIMLACVVGLHIAAGLTLTPRGTVGATLINSSMIFAYGLVTP